MAGLSAAPNPKNAPWGPGHPGWSEGASGLGATAGTAQTAGIPAQNAPNAASSSPQFDLSSILRNFGSGPQPTAPMTNTSSPNPTINKINDAQLKDFSGDMNAGALGRASDIAIRDNAENERLAARQNAASRGVSGGGVEDLQQSAITRDTLRSQTGARVGITNDAEMRRAALGGQIAGQAAMDENLQNQQRALALNQQSMYAQQQQQARDSELDLMGKVLNLFGEKDLFGASGTSGRNPNSFGFG